MGREWFQDGQEVDLRPWSWSPKAEGPLLCVFGNEDPLIPPSDRIAIEEALDRANRLRSENDPPTGFCPGGGPWVHV
jgi:dienelactone hydrolase